MNRPCGRPRGCRSAGGRRIDPVPSRWLRTKVAKSAKSSAPRSQAPAWDRTCLGSFASPRAQRDGARPVGSRRRSRKWRSPTVCGAWESRQGRQTRQVLPEWVFLGALRDLGARIFFAAACSVNAKGERATLGQRPTLRAHPSDQEKNACHPERSGAQDRTAGVLRLLSCPPSPAGNSAQDDTSCAARQRATPLPSACQTGVW
jgi:hypothetical protein